MSHDLLKGKKGIIFGALDNSSIAWKVAEKAHAEGSRFTLTNAPIAIGGSSLGAMTSQIICDKARHWPERLRPDAAFLVTHCGHIEDAVVHGKLAKVWGIAHATIDQGWRSDLIRRYMPLLEAEGQPIIPPENIVTVLGDHDNVTPFDSAKTLIDEWNVPAENQFVYRRGHFSVPIGMMRDHAPLLRLREILKVT